MRAGPLSRKSTIELLNKHFVNTSIIIPEMRKADSVFNDANAIQWAKIVQKEFSYPVDSIILSAQGKPLAQISIEEIFKTIRQGKVGRSYLDVLQTALDQND